MESRAIHFYVGLMSGLALFALVILNWSAVFAIPEKHLIGLVAVVGLGFISESMALQIKIAKNSSGSSITLLPLIASVLLFGPEGAVLFFTVIGVAVEVFVRKKSLIKAAFNVSQLIVSTFAAGVVYTAAGGVPYVVQTIGGTTGDFTLPLGPFILFVVTFLSLNHAAVSLAITLNEEIPFSNVWRQLVGRSGANMLYDLLISPIAIAVVYLYVELWIVGLLVILLPLEFIRHSYLTAFRLQQANRDLLKALVKAIETRDPYTSGHSLRVSRLAVRIATMCGVNSKKIEQIETAALLHDIGKIEAVYSEILKKPDTLTDEERRIIESHVTKGVELLRSLSSFPEEVILAVRHHHERTDGKGYPDALVGEAIPLGARIIKICDAIDAMLSDRPYRNALDISEVKDQLCMFSDIQFDGAIVGKIVDTEILKEHASEINAHKASFSGEREKTTAELGLNPGERVAS